MTEESLFELALNTPEADRSALLDRECQGNPHLRGRVEALLAAHREPAAWLASPHDATGPDEGPATSPGPPAGSPGTVIAGRYKLLQLIGEGGMGSVWMAEQTEPVRRRVAVKLIHAERGSSGQILARFEAERQAIALMDHPNVAKLLDAGTTEEGQPYFVMELVKGVPLTEFCDAHKLRVPERLGLFVQICSAVQHAHQKGVIHRDLKPSNVLVESHDGRPVPKVIDFGLAKATSGMQLTDHTLFTAFGSVMGTPLYMAPEQAGFSAIDVDTRADVYALGVILYELLTGTTPLARDWVKKAAFDELLRLIREQEPPIPSSRISTSEAKPTVAANRQTEPGTLGRFVKGELDWIVMKALSKERERRYETASSFARDVERFLNHEPVSAGPPSAAYRFRKFVRRNRPQVVAAALVLLALLAGMAGTTWGLIEARRQATEARRQEGIARQEAEQKEQARQAESRRAEGERKAKQEAESNLEYARKGNEILGSVFAGLDPRKIAESGRPLQDVLRENLKQAVKQLDGSAIGDPLTVAQMQNTLGLSLAALGESEQAIRVFEKARKTAATRLGPSHPNTLTSMNNLALAYQDVGNLGKALPLFEEALRRSKETLGPDHPFTINTMSNLATAYQDAGKREKALSLLQEAFERSKATLGPEHLYTLNSMNNLALAYQDAGKLNLALPLLEAALRLKKAIFGLEHPDTITAMNNLAAGYKIAGKPGKARPLIEEALRLSKAKFGPDHPHTLTGMNNLAAIYESEGKLELALPLLEETLKLRKARLGADHPSTLTSMNNLAEVYRAAGKPDLALPLLEEALKRQKAKLSPDHPDTLVSTHTLALGYQKAGKPALALPLVEETLKLRKAKLGPEHPDTLTSMNNLALAYQAVGKLEKVLPLLEETLRLRKAKLGPDHPDTLVSMSNLALEYHKAGKLALALPLFEETLKRQKAKLGPEHPDTLASMSNLALTYQAVGKPALALPLLEEMLKLRKAKLGPEHADTLVNMNRLAVGYWMAGRLDRSVPLFEECLTRSQKIAGRAHPTTQQVVANLGVNYKDAGDLDKALPLLEEAHRSSLELPALRWVSLQLLGGYARAGKRAQAVKLAGEILADTRKNLPEGSPQLGGGLASLGLALLEAKAFADAEPLLRESLLIREKTQPDAWTTFNTQSMLGGALLGQKKYDKAEPLLVKGYHGMKEREKSIPALGRGRVPEALDRLIKLYGATNKPDEVKKYRAERAKHPELLPPPLEEK